MSIRAHRHPGYSIGSLVSASLAGAVDTRIHAVVLSGGGDLDGNGGTGTAAARSCAEGRPYQALSFLPDKEAVISPSTNCAPHVFLINGRADTLVDIPHHMEPFFDDARRRAEALSGTDKNIFETYFIPMVSHRPSWVTRPAALWLQKTLNFPAWTAAQINALPESHISDWAAKNNVNMDRGYIQEERKAA